MMVVETLRGVTELRGVVHIVCSDFSRIWRFDVKTQHRLDETVVQDLKDPCDIAACEQTSQLYVADFEECVWRVSADGADIKRWLPKSPSDAAFKPWKLSVTSTRLLVTSRDANHLMQFDSGGDELRRVRLPDDMEPQHAVESPTGTFVVGHYNTRLYQYQVEKISLKKFPRYY